MTTDTTTTTEATEADKKAARIVTLATEAANVAAGLAKAKADDKETAKSMPELLDLIGATTEATPAEAVKAIRACLPLSEAIEKAAKRKCLAVSVVWRNHTMKKAFSARFAHNLKYNKAEGFTLGAAVSEKATTEAAPVSGPAMAAGDALAMARGLAAILGHGPSLADMLTALFGGFTPGAIADAILRDSRFRKDGAELAAHITEDASEQVKAARRALGMAAAA